MILLKNNETNILTLTLDFQWNIMNSFITFQGINETIQILLLLSEE